MRLKYIVENLNGLKEKLFAYYVCNNSEFKKVSVPLGKLKKLSS